MVQNEQRTHVNTHAHTLTHTHTHTHTEGSVMTSERARGDVIIQEK